MAKKKIYFGTNTKMYKTIKDTVEFVSQLQELTKDISREDMQLFVIPSYTTLRDANEAKDEDLLMVGAQNMGWVGVEYPATPASMGIRHCAWRNTCVDPDDTGELPSDGKQSPRIFFPASFMYKIS